MVYEENTEGTILRRTIMSIMDTSKIIKLTIKKRVSLIYIIIIITT